MPNLGTTAPATKAGAFVVGAAEIVGAAVLHGSPPGSAGHRVDHADLRRPAHGAHAHLPLDDRCRFLATELLHTSASRPGAWVSTLQRPGTWLSGVETSCNSCSCRLMAASSTRGLGPGYVQSLHPENLSSTTTSTTALATPSSTSRWTRIAGAGRDRRRRPGRALPRPAAHAQAHARRGDAGGEPGDRAGRPALSRPGRGGRERALDILDTTAPSRSNRRARRIARDSRGRRSQEVEMRLPSSHHRRRPIFLFHGALPSPWGTPCVGGGVVHSGRASGHAREKRPTQ